MTAQELLTLLSAADCPPSVEGDELTFDRDIPPDLEPFVELLQTGLRAILTDHRWFGIDAIGRGIGPGRDGALRTDALLPATVVLLIVEVSLDGWDRIDSKARDYLPEAFEHASSAKPGKVKTR